MDKVTMRNTIFMVKNRGIHGDSDGAREAQCREEGKR